MSSDDELLNRLRETPFAELSDEELNTLTHRAAKSPVVRDALIARILLEQALHADLDEPGICVAEIVKATRPRRASRGGLIVGVVGICLIFAGLLAWSSWGRSSVRPTDIVAPPAYSGRINPNPTQKDHPATSRADMIPRHPPVEAPRSDRPSGDPIVDSLADAQPPSEANWLDAIPSIIKSAVATDLELLTPTIQRLLLAPREFERLSSRLGQFRPRRFDAPIDTFMAFFAPQFHRRLMDHPLATEPNREGVTLSLELEAALAAGALADAARLIPTLAEINGLVPALGDPQRIVPSEILIATALARYPRLATVLESTYGPAALQEVRQAIAEQDHAAIERIAVRFQGTQAAAEARRWLGELALAKGDIFAAHGQFQAALAAIPRDEQADLRARIRLGAALGGSLNEDQAASTPIALGPLTIAPDSWNALLSELNTRHRADASAAPPLILPELGARRASEQLVVTGDLGRNPSRGKDNNFDWAGRQLSVTVHRGTAYISNRFQVVAYRLDRGAALWTTGLGAEQGDAHAWPNISFKPLIDDDRLIVRRLLGRGPELAALSLDGEGIVLWRSDDDLTIASEPWIRDKAVWAITTPDIRRGDRPVVLSLTRFRIDDGRSLDSVPLLVLDPAATDTPAAHVTPHPHGFCLVTRGAAGCFDQAGQTRWLRRLPFLPAGIDPRLDQVAVTPPLVVGERLYLSLPDTRQLHCINVSSGRRLWTRSLADLSRLITANENVVIVRAGNSLRGLDPGSGLLKWSGRHEGLLDGALFDAQTLLVPQYLLSDGEPTLQLTWLGIDNGRRQYETAVTMNNDPTDSAGPFFLANGAAYLFLGESSGTGERTLIELLPKTEK